MSARPSHTIVADILRDILAGRLPCDVFERRLKPYVRMEIGSSIGAVHFLHRTEISGRLGVSSA
jgi:hypothetical protein